MLLLLKYIHYSEVIYQKNPPLVLRKRLHILVKLSKFSTWMTSFGAAPTEPTTLTSLTTAQVNYISPTNTVTLSDLAPRMVCCHHVACSICT